MRKKLENILQKHEKHIIIFIGIVLALVLRFDLRNFQSADYTHFLEKWYDFIVNNGRFLAFKHEFFNYTPPYLYLMCFATFTNLPKIVAIKLISVIFDFIAAYFSYKIVKIKYSQSQFPVLASITVLFLPTVFLNSSYWGQCDIIYTTGLLACLYFLMIGKENWGFISFGLAISFKQQAIFLLPFLLILFLKKKVSLKSFLIIPLPYFLFALPVWLLGRPLKEALLIYFKQHKGGFRRLAASGPNIYHWLTVNVDFTETHFKTFLFLGLILASFLIGLLIFMVYNSRIKITPEIMLQIAFISLLFTPYFLPSMKQRYFFAADIFSILCSFYYPQYLWIALYV